MPPLTVDVNVCELGASMYVVEAGVMPTVNAGPVVTTAAFCV